MFCPVCQNAARRVGHNRNGSQRYRCDECARYFTDESTQPQDGRRVSREKMLTILRLLMEGSSIRSLERVYGVHRDTIIANMIDAGNKCEWFLFEKIVGMPAEDVQVDEIWGFVGCKEKTRQKLHLPGIFGDVWTFTAIERTTKLLLAWHVGKRTPTDTAMFAHKLDHATVGRFQLTTDGYRPYLHTIPAVLGHRVDYASLVKVYGNAEDDRGYSPGKVIDTIETIHLGAPDPARICTSHVERHNKTLRMQIRRLTRLTDAHSKKWENHRAAVALFIAYYNFCRRHMTLKTTPAQAAGLTTETWSLERLLSEVNRVQSV
jgi:transposase-like protein/IS1 family transposase